MISAGQVVLEAAKMLAVGGQPLAIVEVGTINGLAWNYAMDGGFSTLHLAYWIREVGAKHELYTCEVDQASLDASRQVLAWYGLESIANYHHDDAMNVLRSLAHLGKTIDLLYLDGASDPRQTFEQFTLAQPLLTKRSVVIIDDVYERKEENKGELLIPALQSCGTRVAKVIGRMAAFGYGAEDIIDRLEKLNRAD